MSLPVYSSKDVKIAWNGTTLDGLAPDSFITFSRSSDVTDEEIGSDGLVAISRLPDKTGTVNLIFQQSSYSNQILAGVLLEQESSRRFIVGDLTITDPSGTVLAELGKTHIKTAPEIDLGSSATGKNRTWVFFCQTMKFKSNPSGSSLIAESQNFINSQINDIFSRIV